MGGWSHHDPSSNTRYKKCNLSIRKNADHLLRNVNLLRSDVGSLPYRRYTSSRPVIEWVNVMSSLCGKDVTFRTFDEDNLKGNGQ